MGTDIQPDRHPGNVLPVLPPLLPGESLPALADSTPSNESKLLLEYLVLLGRNTILLGVLAVFGLLIGLLVSYVETPLYMARATVEIESLNGDYLNLKSFDPTTAFQDISPEGQIATQAKIIESDSVVERVVKDLNATYAKDPTHAKAMGAGLDAAVASLQVRLIPDTHILELVCNSPNGQAAADFANALAARYIDQNLESRIHVTEQTEASLRTQLGEVKAKLQQAEQNLLSYAQHSNLMFTGEAQTSVAEDKLRLAQEALSQAESDRAIKQSQFESAAAVPPELLPSMMEEAGSRDTESKLAGLRSELADEGTYMAPTHPKIVRLKAQIAALEATIRNQGVLLAQKITNDYDAVRRRESLLRSNYDAQSKLVTDQAEKTIQYTILKSETETYRALYDSLLQKVKDAGVAKAMRANNVRLVDRAKTPMTPFRPRFLRNALMGLAAGMFMGIAFITIRARADFNIRSPGETSARLRVPELGVIPNAELGGNETRLLVGAEGGSTQAVALSNGHGHSLHFGGNGHSTAFAESIRATLASLLFSDRNEDHRAIVITSAGPGEGKSTIISYLGLAMAETDRRVLLIDGDLRHPQLHKIFGISNASGLSEWLRSGDFSQEAIAKTALCRSLQGPVFLFFQPEA